MVFQRLHSVLISFWYCVTKLLTFFVVTFLKVLSCQNYDALKFWSFLFLCSSISCMWRAVCLSFCWSCHFNLFLFWHFWGNRLRHSVLMYDGPQKVEKKLNTLTLKTCFYRKCPNAKSTDKTRAVISEDSPFNLEESTCMQILQSA